MALSLATPAVSGSSAGGSASSASSVPATAAASGASPSAAPLTNSAENTRLLIEDDKAAGCFVYKVIDSKTGVVLQQTPSEQMVKLRESDGYLAGDVVKAQA